MLLNYFKRLLREMFDFIRKRKVQKVLDSYKEILHKHIPEDTLAREELEALRDIELKELAISYDALGGYDFFKTPDPYIFLPGDAKIGANPTYTVDHYIPGYSRCIPNRVSKPTKNKLLKLRRQLAYTKLQDEYLHLPEFDGNRVVEESAEWKIK
jgi:hypothetical protein